MKGHTTAWRRLPGSGRRVNWNGSILRANEQQIVADGKIMAEHERDITRDHGPGHTIYNWRHYLAVVQRKPGA
ncbi:hypothetical protein GJ699_34065, partial [Duganella sp. FT80W]|nr:hypothetical protein [Duganella guangzhouensis]